MVRHMYETVALLYLGKQALRAVKFLFQNGVPRRVLQVLSPEVGELHEILVVMITTAGKNRVERVEVKFLQYALE